MNRDHKVLLTLVGGLIVGGMAAAPLAGRAHEPWKSGEIIEPQTLSQELSSAHSKPLVLQVGFLQLYDLAHIPGALYCGPASTPEGLERLRACVEKIPRTRRIVIYCGCCPWKQCPNIRPAYRELKSLGFRRVKALEIGQDFGQDWLKQGFPTVSVP